MSTSGSRPRFYLTTPIYYVTAEPHIGTSYTTIAADVIARYKRLCGYDVHFLTGTDEHGLKVQREAENRGMEPLALADEVVTAYQRQWQRLNISNDDFIRTTEPRHERVVQQVFQRLHDNGDLVLGKYAGWYCVSCESFLDATDQAEPLCPDCGKRAERYEEPTYYFRFGKYQDRLLAHFEAHPEFLRPRARYNEILNRIRDGLRDISFTRTELEWAVPLPFDPKHRAYVWIDALVNYISALGYGSENPELFQRFWPADVHLVGKDIAWFHAAIWPCMLMAIGVGPPLQVFAHGWWTHNGEKMSKSRNNFVMPDKVADVYGVDAFRYFVLRELTFGQDGDFRDEAMHHRYHGDLANDLGNLAYRTTSMMERYFAGRLPSPEAEPSGPLAQAAEGLFAAVDAEMDGLQFSRALEAIWRFVRRANQYVEERQPWRLAKDPDARPRLAATMYHLAEALRIMAVYVSPFMPETAERLMDQIHPGGELGVLPDAARWGQVRPGAVVRKGAHLFPKIE